MSRPRSCQLTKNLPANLYSKIDKRTGKTYYTWRNPETNKSHGFGDNKELAIKKALELNGGLINQLEKTIFEIKKGQLAPVTIGTIADENGLLNHDCVIKLSTKYRFISGVYFLIKNDVVVYVGQSGNCFLRIAQHIKNQVKFDSYSIIDAPAEYRTKLEGMYINKFKPELNKVIPNISEKNWNAPEINLE